MTQAILKGIPTTASDWSLYSSMEGVEGAAMKIAQTLSDAIRANYTADTALDLHARDVARNVVINAFDRVLSEMSDYGATDGEAYDIGSRLINTAFPRQEKFNW